MKKVSRPAEILKALVDFFKGSKPGGKAADPGHLTFTLLLGLDFFDRIEFYKKKYVHCLSAWYEDLCKDYFTASETMERYRGIDKEVMEIAGRKFKGAEFQLSLLGSKDVNRLVLETGDTRFVKVDDILSPMEFDARDEDNRPYKVRLTSKVLSDNGFSRSIYFLELDRAALQCATDLMEMVIRQSSYKIQAMGESDADNGEIEGMKAFLESMFVRYNSLQNSDPVRFHYGKGNRFSDMARDTIGDDRVDCIHASNERDPVYDSETMKILGDYCNSAMWAR